MQFTSQQTIAIETHDKNLIVAAGAGSGKTRVLVERYFRLLQNNPDWQLNSLVAITFTREAALEMRNRVRVQLEGYLKTDETGWAAHLLAQMDSARIDTIHALCATLLRANAAEAGVDPTFDVLDEVDAGLLVDDVVNDVLQSLSGDDPDDIVALFTQYDGSSIRKALKNPELLAAELPELPGDASAIFEQWTALWRERFLALVAGLHQNTGFMEALNWLPDLNGLSDEDKLYPSWANVIQYRDSILNLDDLAVVYQGMQFLGSNEAIKLNGGSQKYWGSKDRVEDAKACLRIIRETLDAAVKQAGRLPGELDLLAADMLLRWHKLIRRVQAAYTQAKMRAGVLDFNDLEQRTAHLLTHNPAVRLRYQGAEFKHLLVDEFQDTNRAQWQIVKALASLDMPGSMFVVGDLKQSIYGFRGADVSVFDDVRQEITGRTGGLAVALSKSFRSHRGLIGIFNALFEKILIKDDTSPVVKYQVRLDDRLEANRQDLPLRLPVEIILLSGDQAARKLDIAGIRTWEAWEIGQRLLDLCRPDSEYGFTFGEVAILFQAMSHVTLYESVFKDLGIPYVTIAGRGYYSRQEVWDVLNLLRAVNNPADSLSLAAALRSPMFGFSDDMLLMLRQYRPEQPENPEQTDPAMQPKLPPPSLWDALLHAASGGAIPGLQETDRNLIYRTAQHLNALRQLAGRVTISELLRQAMARTGYLAMLTGLPDGARRRRNVEKLLDIADRSGRITVGDFTRYLEDLTEREVRESEATLDAEGAVRLMSVHASKGLEFPIVVLADAQWTKSGGGENQAVIFDSKYGLTCTVYDAEARKQVKSLLYQWADDEQKMRDEAERRRLLYVAATRARDLLIISGKATLDKTGWKASGWLGQLLTAAELEDAYDGMEKMLTDEGGILTRVPVYDEKLIQQSVGKPQRKNTWEKLPELAAHSAAQPPPLLQQISIRPENFLGHLAATGLAAIGGAIHAERDEEREHYRASLRRQALDDAPAQIREVIRPFDPRVTRRLIGEIVHEALRYWRFPDKFTAIEPILRSYAWSHYIVAESDVREAIGQSLDMLERFRRSEIYHWIEASRAQKRPFYPELPFIYRVEKRIIHGVIDILFQHTDGRWILVDYKTGYVPPHEAEKHARRYFLQVGVYASAVQAQLGVIPDVYIHFIRYNITVPVPTADWQTELAQLEAYTGSVVGSRYD